MIRKRKGEIQWLEFEILQKFPHIAHGVFLRHGGVSSGPYQSLNIGGGSKDDPLCTSINRERIKEVFHLDKLCARKQVHKSGISFIEDTYTVDEEGDFDALITKEEEIGLLIKHADCQAAIFYDCKQDVIGNVHCGWRGNVQNLYKEVVEYFIQNLKSNPKDLLVCISPSLGPQHAEFIHYQKEFPQALWEFQWKPHYFNLWEISKKQLLDAKIPDQNIEIASICTYEEPADFFSYRRDKVTGRHGTIVAKKRLH